MGMFDNARDAHAAGEHDAGDTSGVCPACEHGPEHDAGAHDDAAVPGCPDCDALMCDDAAPVGRCRHVGPFNGHACEYDAGHAGRHGAIVAGEWPEWSDDDGPDGPARVDPACSAAESDR